jgi:hypothetical protein
MDKLEQYRHAIKKILTEYYEISNPQNVENGKMDGKLQHNLPVESFPLFKKPSCISAASGLA